MGGVPMSFIPHPINFLTGSLTSLSQVLSATSLAATITVPAGVQGGDLLVLLDNALGATVPATVIPTGFTSIGNINDGGQARQILSYKIADGSEASTSITGMDSTSETKALYVFRGDAPITSASPASVNGEATTGNPVSQTVTSGSGLAPLIVIGGYGANVAVSPRTMSPAKDGEINPSTVMYLAYKIYNLSPSDVSVDMDDEGINYLQSCYIACG
jgi:hypothetical protein